MTRIEPRAACSGLLPVDAGADEREAFRQGVLTHRQARSVPLGEHLILQFEDGLSAQHYVQEWLWTSRSGDPVAIQHQLDAHNVLIPSGTHLIATRRFQHVEQPQRPLDRVALIGIEQQIYAEVEGLGRSFALVEQISSPAQSSSVHGLQYLRFEFSPEQIMAVRAGAEFGFGIDDDRMRVAHTLKRARRAALLADFDQPQS
ncbi:MAG: DUF3501 family protein [Pseudomarimonas sp.]